jgi:hypothetical protein
MKRNYERIRNAIKATNKNKKISDWLSTYREVLYDLMKMKSAIYDLEDKYKYIKEVVTDQDWLVNVAHSATHRRLYKIEKKLGITR